MQKWLKKTGLVLMLGVVGAGFYYAIKENPISVDVAIVKRTEMQVSIKEEGVTRVRNVYRVSSPIAGHLDRIILEEGQAVFSNNTIVASIHPSDPPFLDQRTQQELQSAVKAAQSAVALAKVEHNRAELALHLNQSEYERASILARKKILPLSQLEKSYNALQLQKAQVKSSAAVIELRIAELESVRARQRQPQSVATSSKKKDCCIDILAPVDGVVLKILARSEQAVAPGSLIAEIGDPKDLEVVVDLLSKDAAKINPGAIVELSDWGGDAVLIGSIKRVDPAAFTKTSSLGIEEQRVNVIVDLPSPPPGLGHGYRVLANLVIWKQDDILQVPIGALFRASGNWAVFLVEDGGVTIKNLKLGEMTDQSAQVLGGLNENDEVVLYPNDALVNGSAIERR